MSAGLVYTRVVLGLAGSKSCDPALSWLPVNDLHVCLDQDLRQKVP